MLACWQAFVTFEFFCNNILLKIYHGAKELFASLKIANQNLTRNVLKKILKTSKVKGQIYMKRSPKFCYTKLISTKCNDGLTINSYVKCILCKLS